jgi:hypothetical protein
MIKNNKIIIASIIGTLVFCLMGIPFTNWWFNGCDDFGGAYIGYVTTTWRDLFYFFIKGHINQALGPSNIPFQHTMPHFFDAYYRPFYLIFLTLQYWIFGLNAYAYFLCNVFFHALNTALLFIIFSWIIDLIPAFLITLLFAFHPQIGYRFGAIVNLHYYVSVASLLGVLILYKKHLDEEIVWAYWAACCLYAFSLFTRESSIVFPAILTLGTYLYLNKTTILQVLKKTAVFWCITFLFLLFRLALFPLRLSAAKSPVWTTMLQAKLSEFMVFLYDAFWLSWLPWGHPFIRGTLLFMVLGGIGYLFVINTRKRLLLFFLLSATLMLWPAYVGCYSPRYIYEALPFILLFFIGCVIWAPINFKSLKKWGWGLLGIVVMFFMFLTIDNLGRRERKMAVIASALHRLATIPDITKRPLYLLSYPMDGLGDQPCDIIRVILKQPAALVYRAPSAAYVQIGAHIVAPTSWRNVISNYYHENFAIITPVRAGFLYHVTHPCKIYFITQENKQDFIVHIDKDILNKNPIFLRWDAPSQSFEVV